MSGFWVDQNAAPHSKHRGVSVVLGLDWFSCGAFLLRAVKVKSLTHTSVVLLYVFGQMLLKTGFGLEKTYGPIFIG